MGASVREVLASREGMMTSRASDEEELWSDIRTVPSNDLPWQVSKEIALEGNLS